MRTQAEAYGMPLTAKEDRPSVVHLSPLRRTKGGISTVVSQYLESELTTLFDLRTIETHRDGPGHVKLWTAIKAFGDAVKQAAFQAPDVTHVHIGDFPSIFRKAFTSLPLLLSGGAKVLHFHGAEFQKQFATLSVPTQKLVRWYIARFDVVICLSQSWRNNLEAEFSPHRLFILPNAVQLPHKMAPKSKDRPLEIVFLGSLDDRKGVFDLLRAFSDLIKHYPNVVLKIGGAGDHARLLNDISSLGIENSTEYLGWLDADRRNQVLQSASVFVLPSYAEGLPMALLEAMSYRLAVVTTPVGGIPELIQDGTNGMLVSPGDIDALTGALRRATQDAAFRNKIAEAARLTIERDYGIGEHVVKLAGLYESLLVGSGAKRP